MRKLLILVAALAASVPASVASGADSAAAPTLVVRSSAYGPMLFGGNGRAIYGFTRDVRGGKSRCYGACATAWPVYYAGKAKLTAGKGVNARLIGTTRRSDGRLQVTYNGWPLYFYAHEGPGEVRCQNVPGFGGIWLVVSPKGNLIR